jgi:hypothetical protein
VVKSKTTDHQWFVPLGLSGKMSRSSSVSGIFLIAPRFMTAAVSCGPYAVGNNLRGIRVETIWTRFPFVDVSMYSLRRARYESIMLVSRYCSIDRAGQIRRVKFLRCHQQFRGA